MRIPAFVALCAIVFFFATDVRSQCLGANTLTITPPFDSLPTLGPGTVVEVEFKVNFFTQVNSNWFHGVSFQFGPQFAQNSIIPAEIPLACDTANGNWAWYPSSTNLEISTDWASYSAGFYFDASGTGGVGVLDSFPANNFGDNCTSSDPTQWRFVVQATYIGGDDPGLFIDVHPDGESGIWGMPACLDDHISIGTICPHPDGLRSLTFDGLGTIDTAQALLDWDDHDSASVYRLAAQLPGGSIVGRTLGVSELLSPDLIPGEDYIYAVAARCPSGLTSTFSQLHLFQVPVLRQFNPGLADLISIFPNPSTGVFQISGLDVKRVLAYSLQGKLLGEFHSTNVIDLSAFNDGMILFNIETTQGEIVNRSVMLNR
jgi:hypothetical protein